MKYWIKRQFKRIHTWWKRYPKVPPREPTVSIRDLDRLMKLAYPAHRITELAAKPHPLFSNEGAGTLIKLKEHPIGGRIGPEDWDGSYDEERNRLPRTSPVEQPCSCHDADNDGANACRTIDEALAADAECLGCNSAGRRRLARYLIDE